MRKHLLLQITTSLILLTTALQAFAQAEHPDFNAEWRMRLQGSEAQSTMSQSHLVNFRFDLNMNYWVSSDLYFDLSPRIQMQSGSTQSYDESAQANNKLLLNQAALQWLPVDSFLMSAGALDQGRLHSSILLGENAFPSLRATYTILNSALNSRLIIENAIPTSASMSTNTSELEPSPSFQQAQLQINWEPQKFTYLKNSIGYFQYHNLPTSVATSSALQGNTVDRISDAQSKFKYEYQGLEIQTELSQPLFNKFDLKVAGSFVQNQAAPKSLNQGYVLSAGGSYRLNAKTEIEILNNYFRIEPDASVADFSSDDNFNTNRIGYRTDLLLTLKNKYKLGLSYSEAQPLYINPAQSQEKSIRIKLETNYASI